MSGTTNPNPNPNLALDLDAEVFKNKLRTLQEAGEPWFRIEIIPDADNANQEAFKTNAQNNLTAILLEALHQISEPPPDSSNSRIIQ